MGGRGASLSAGGLAKLTDKQLDFKIMIVEGEIEGKRKKLATIASQNPPWKMPGEFYATKKQQVMLENKRRKYLDELLRRQDMKPKAKAPVERYTNGYGEMTSRDIATASYKRQQRALDKRIRQMLGDWS